MGSENDQPNDNAQTRKFASGKRSKDSEWSEGLDLASIDRLVKDIKSGAYIGDSDHECHAVFKKLVDRKLQRTLAAHKRLSFSKSQVSIEYKAICKQHFTEFADEHDIICMSGPEMTNPITSKTFMMTEPPPPLTDPIEADLLAFRQ